MLHDIGKVAGETELVGELVGQRGREVVVEPVVVDVCRRNLKTCRGVRGTDIVVGEVGIVTVGRSVRVSGILALQLLPFEAGAIVDIQFRDDIPVVSEVEGELVLMAAVELRGVLVEIVEVGRAQVAVVEADGIAAVVGLRHDIRVCTYSPV